MTTFRVEFEKSYELIIEADSLDGLEEALLAATESDLETWSGDTDWGFHVIRPVSRSPEMVLAGGEFLHPSDAKP